MSEIVIWGVPGSPYVRMALLAAEEKGVAWRLAPLQMGESKTPGHLERHPFGRMPVMDHGDVRLYEAQAITRYIDLAFEGPSLQPADALGVARMSQVMNIVDSYVAASIGGGIVFNRLVAPMFGLPTNEEAVQAAIAPAKVCLTALEDILGAGPCFGGASVSLADLHAIAFLDFFPATPEGGQLLAGSPLLGWLERMAERPSVQATSMPVLRAKYAPQPA